MGKPFSNGILRGALRWVLGCALFAGLLLLFLSAVGAANRRSASEGARLAEESIRRAAVTCYAVEGSYPESYAYIREHYGVAVDETRYTVFYQVFASNMMPDIVVLEGGGAA